MTKRERISVKASENPVSAVFVMVYAAVTALILLGWWPS